MFDFYVRGDHACGVMEIRTLPEAIRATLIWFELFDRALTIDEIARYLFCWNAGIAEIARQVESMGLKQIGPYVVREGHEHLQELRVCQDQAAERLWRRVYRFAPLFKRIPGVQMVGVCNSLAFGSVSEKSDIDLFVVADKGRLATARVGLKFLTHLLGARVHHEKKAGRFCLSFCVSEDAMDLSWLPFGFDPYAAYFVKTMIPLFGSATYQKFLSENCGWVQRYGPLIPRTDFLFDVKSEFESKESNSYFEKEMEKVLSRYQSKRDFRYIASLASAEGVVVTEKIFKCHERDERKSLAERFLNEFHCASQNSN